MIQQGQFRTWHDLCRRAYAFEAGTPHIAGAIGLAAAIIINSIGPEAIAEYENGLLRYVTEQLEEVDGIKLIGTAKEKVGVVSFVMDDAHPHDIGTILDTEGIAVRAGHHCAQPPQFLQCSRYRACFVGILQYARRNGCAGHGDA